LPSRHDLSKIYISNDESFIYLPVGKSNSSRPYEFSSNFLIISDPHILGPNINFIDKFWHELNMQISFNAILAALSGHWKNEYEKIILGDILDFGLFYRSTDQNNQVFQKDLNIFYKIFKNSHAVLGNHDVAFPLMTNPQRINRMNNIFGRKSTSEIIRFPATKANFVILNSSGFIDQEKTKTNYNKEIGRISEQNIEEISKVFEQNYPEELTIYQKSLINGTLYLRNEAKSRIPDRPIILQHFPLWRLNDELCKNNLADSAKYTDRNTINNPDREALSPGISGKIIKKIKPKMIFSGHTHNGCLRKHDNNLLEVSVASFNYRNRDNPVYILLKIFDDKIMVSKNFVPRQSWLIARHFFATSFVIGIAIKNCCWKRANVSKNKIN